MRRTYRIGLTTTAVVLAFGITYIAFAPQPFGDRAGIVQPVVAAADDGSGWATNDADTAVPTTGTAPDQRTLGVGEEPGNRTTPPAAAEPEREAAPDYTPQARVNHYQQGQQLFWQRDYAAAAIELERATRQRPGTYYPHYLLGLTYQRLGDSQQALREYVAAREINGEQPEALVNLARLYLGLDNPTEALELTTQATEVTPDYDAAWNVHGRAHLALGDRAAAVNAFTEATRLGPNNAYARNNLGYALILGAEFEAALAPLQEAVSIQQKVPYMHNNLGVVLEQLGRLEEAHQAYARAAELSPTHLAAVANAQRLAELLPESPAADPAPALAGPLAPPATTPTSDAVLTSNTMD